MTRLFPLYAFGLFFALAAHAGDALRGKQIVLARGDGNCLLCHAVPGAERPAGNLGPSLAGVGRRLSEEEIFWRIVDASRFNADTVMPPYGRIDGLHAVAPEYRGKPILSTSQIEDAAAFLATLR
jgi:sulfur-oxidizing protein SoxX